jgi:hypothetical protein
MKIMQRAREKKKRGDIFCMVFITFFTPRSPRLYREMISVFNIRFEIPDMLCWKLKIPGLTKRQFQIS